MAGSGLRLARQPLWLSPPASPESAADDRPPMTAPGLQALGQNARGALLALLAFAIYASHDAVIKALGATYTTPQIVFFATMLGMPLAILMLAADRHPGTILPRHPGWMAVRTAGVIVSGVAGFYAFTLLPLAQVYALLFATPLLITLLAVPVLGERVGPHRLVAVLVGFAGVMVVLRPGHAEIGLGHLAALLAALAGSLAAVASRRIARFERPAVMVIWPMLGNFVVMGAVMPFVYVPVTGVHLAMLGYVAACSFGALLLLVIAYRLAEAAVVAPMQYSQILWATLFGALFFDEIPDAWTFAGAAIVIASGLYIVLREARGAVSEHQPVTTAPARPHSGDPGLG
jgi:S-adenosylmethionine uptake transporter